jgi:hypothetical protein
MFTFKFKEGNKKMILGKIKSVKDEIVEITTGSNTLKLFCLASKINRPDLDLKKQVIVFYKTSQILKQLPELIAIYNESIPYAHFKSIHTKISTRLGEMGL